MENDEDWHIKREELNQLKREFNREEYAGRMEKALKEFANEAPKHPGILNRLKQLWEIVGSTDHNIEIEDDMDYLEETYKRWIDTNKGLATRNKWKEQDEFVPIERIVGTNIGFFTA
jgi:hypothetical protein